MLGHHLLSRVGNWDPSNSCNMLLYLCEMALGNSVIIITWLFCKRFLEYVVYYCQFNKLNLDWIFDFKTQPESL